MATCVKYLNQLLPNISGWPWMMSLNDHDATSAGIDLFISIRGQMFPWFDEAYRCLLVRRYLFSLIKSVQYSLAVFMLVLDKYCNLVLNIRLPVIMLLAIKVSPSSSPEWLMFDSIILVSLDFIYCHRESFGRLVPILAPSTLYGTRLPEGYLRKLGSKRDY